MIGEQILNYQVERLISQNQLSRSYLATHTQYPKKVIIKNYSTEIFDNQHSREQFMDEVKKLSHIQHPNIVTFYDYSENALEFNLFFEYVEARSLTDYIKNVSGPIPEDKAKKMILQIIDALILAQKNGLGNGSLSGNHILIREDGQIKLLETALSNFQRLSDTNTQEVSLLISLSPEQLREGKPSPTSEIYSLGMILFQMLTGKTPYENNPVEEVKKEIISSPLPEMTAFYPMVSQELQAIVNKATHKSPSQRFQNLEALKKAILDIDEYRKEKQRKAEEAQVKVEKQKKVIVQEPLDPKNVRFVNLPLYLFLGLATLVALLYYAYTHPTRTLKSEVLINLQDSNRIKSKSDSIDRARAKKELQDSVRIAKLTKKKDTAIFYMHRSRAGETPESIAGKYYLSVDTILKINDMQNVRKNEKLEPKYGIKVKVRAIHKMAKDETLDKVAFRYGISKLILIQTNNILDEKEEVYEGKNIVIPIIASR